MRSARIRFGAPSSGARALGQALGFAPADLPKLLAAIAADSEEGREEAAVAAKAQKQALVARVGLAACAVAFFSLVYVFIMYTDVVMLRTAWRHLVVCARRTAWARLLPCRSRAFVRERF